MYRYFLGYLFFQMFFLCLPASSYAYALYEANPELSVVAPYDTIAVGAGNVGNAAAGNSEFFSFGQKYRIRQNGSITRVRLYVADVTNVTGVYVKIWRNTGSNSYNLIGTSENLTSGLVASSINTIDLATPITGVKEGDYYSFRLETSASVNPFVRHAATNANIYVVTNSTPASTGFTWESQTDTLGTGWAVPIEFYMQAPQVVFIGDSLMAGHPAHYTFLESNRVTNIESTLEKQFSNLTNYTYQNMGVGSQNTTNIASRFTTDVINLHPRIVVMEGGGNDNFLGGAPAKTLFLNNWTSMLDAAQASDSIATIIVLKILPCSNINSGCNNTEEQVTDDWNNSLAAIAAGYSKAIVVDTKNYVGQFRVGGDPGNLWDIITAYDAGDGVHYNQAGHTQIAQAIVDNFLATPENLSASFDVSHMVLTVDNFLNDTAGSAGYYFSSSGGQNSGWIQSSSWQDMGLNCGNTYVYSVKYRNSVGAESDSISVTKSTDNCGAVAVAVSQPYIQMSNAQGNYTQPSQIPQTPTPTPVKVTDSNKTPNVSSMFEKNLSFGILSLDVRRLQQLLATDKEIYPEGIISGYFGPLTKKSIQRFQLKYNVVNSVKDSGFGVFGPKTRSKIKEVF